MTDTSTADELPPQTNGVVDNNGLLDDEERARMRPADIDADVREMERRKRVEMIMNSKLFREELERIIETQLRDGSGTSGLLQQISDMVGVNKQAGNVFKNSSCVIPINDIRGIESMGYGKGEKILRCKLAAVFRLIDLYGWTQGANTLITARLNQEDEQFLVNPYGMLFHEITASSLLKVGMQGHVLEQGTTNFSVNVTAFSLHAAVHAARPDLRCIIHVHTPSVVAVSALKQGLLPLSQESVVIGEVSTHPYLGGLLDADEKHKLARNLGPINKVLLLSNQGALCCGETIEEAFYNARNTILASESQLKLLPLGVDNLVLLNDEARKKIYDAAHKAPESSPRPDQPSILEGKVERKWRVGGVEFEALMRMLDNAGFRTGYIYRHPLIKGEPPRPKNDVELPPAVSSLGYLLEEEELYKQGLWKKLEGGRKGHDRSRWLNSPNVYQKVEILETGTPDPKKITKWVAEASPNHSSTPVKIEDVLQFVPKGTNPKEFKQKQQEIKDYRRADKKSAGPQSHILEGVTWEEAKKMQDAAVTQTGDQVVLMGAASKGIIQRGHQHNATVYKSPYAKNPFDSVTDEELEDYKKVVERKAKGDYDTDYSESDGLSSAQINKRFDNLHLRSPTSVTSETEEESRDEPQILRIETTTAPKPSQPEVVLSDVDTPVEQFLRAERTSFNSFKSVLTNETLNKQNCHYRTYSHAGHPKGSYAVPNPVHFHVARITRYVQIQRPLIKTLTRSFYVESQRFRERPVVSLSIDGTHSVALDISLKNLRAFINPFARALNLVEIPLLSNRSSQTSYIRNFDRSALIPENIQYTPLLVDNYTDTLHLATNSSFERQVLDSLHNDILNEAVGSDDEAKLGDTIQFQDQMGESMAELSNSLINLISLNSSGKNSFEDLTCLVKNNNEKDLEEFCSGCEDLVDDQTKQNGHSQSNSIDDLTYPITTENLNATTKKDDSNELNDLTYSIIIQKKSEEANSCNLTADTKITKEISDQVDYLLSNNATQHTENQEAIMENIPQMSANNGSSCAENLKSSEPSSSIFDRSDPKPDQDESEETTKHHTSFATNSSDNSGFNFSENFLKVVNGYQDAVGVIKEVKHILQRRNMDESKSVDEGFDDRSGTINNDTLSSDYNVDERAVRLSRMIIDHLIDQGLELDDLIVFAEVNRDLHIQKLINKLKQYYDEVFQETQSSEELNYLYLEISNCVMKMLGDDKRFKNQQTSPDNTFNVSDKLFAISEYLSDILDHFFSAIESDEFKHFSRDLSEKSVAQSTPDKQDTKECLNESITAFHKHSKQTSESLWFAISPSPALASDSTSAKRVVVNVDDIPLKPPADLLDFNTPKNGFSVLSPIREEPRKLSFSQDDTQSESSVTSEDFEVLCDTDDDEVNPECRKIVVSSQVQFFRTKSQSATFSQTNNIVFTTREVKKTNSMEENKENLNDSGDWMGFDQARF